MATRSPLSRIFLRECRGGISICNAKSASPGAIVESLDLWRVMNADLYFQLYASTEVAFLQFISAFLSNDFPLLPLGQGLLHNSVLSRFLEFGS